MILNISKNKLIVSEESISEKAETKYIFENEEFRESFNVIVV